MSMFHELMMRKKEQTMYATIKGTLTENDGVFSGFSENGYLNINQSISLGSNFEIVTKITTGADVSSQTVFISGKTSPYFNISIQNGKTQQNIGNGSVWLIIISNQTFGTTDIQPNTSYLVKFTFDGSTYKTFLSTDNGKTWILDWSYSSSATIPACQIVYGVSRSLTNKWNGSIDLNKSYIKLGSTKYKLQAVVGYTVVGSPTESPTGVFGGLDSSNYLKIDNANILSQADNWEIMMKLVTVGTSIGQYFIGTNKQICLTIGAGASVLYLSSNGTSWDIASGVGLSSRIPDNSYVRLRFTGTQYILDYSSDKLTWTKCTEISSTTKITSTLTYMKIGSWWEDSTKFTGTLDIKETYIKINNKLWFNGQQA